MNIIPAWLKDFVHHTTHPSTVSDGNGYLNGHGEEVNRMQLELHQKAQATRDKLDDFDRVLAGLNATDAPHGDQSDQSTKR